jgi:hypothetical protein
MTVKTKSVWPEGDGLLETPDEDLEGKRHLCPVIREGSDWHIPRSNHADNIIMSFLTLNERRHRSKKPDFLRSADPEATLVRQDGFSFPPISSARPQTLGKLAVASAASAVQLPPPCLRLPIAFAS